MYKCVGLKIIFGTFLHHTVHDEESGDDTVRLCRLMPSRLKSSAIIVYAIIVSLIVEKEFIVEQTLAK